jgi:hypothetical protein
VLEQRLTTDNYLNFLTNELPLLVEEVPLETRRAIIFQQDGAPPHFGQVTAYLNQRYENRWIGRLGPITWPPIFPDLIPLHLFLWDVMKDMTYRTKVQARGELLHQFMDAAANTRDHPEVIQRALNACLERARLRIENRAGQ